MNGILLIDKQQDWTSNDVVSKLRGVLHEKRVGHSGTLDPMATGLLLVFVGRATRAVEFSEKHDKRYIASLRLGTRTDTQDITGKVLRQSEVTVTEAQLAQVLKDFLGEQKQIPPMYSAIKIKGKKLYEIARSGGEVERQPRDIRIDKLNIIGRAGDDYVIDICCSKGTYIRTLCNDIGDRLGCGACMSALRRVSVGSFSVDNAVTIEQLQHIAEEGKVSDCLIPVDMLFKSAKKCTVSQAVEKRIRCGNDVALNIPDGEYRVYSSDGEFLMLGLAKQGVLKTVKSFFEVY